jgi:hypothetical protein
VLALVLAIAALALAMPASPLLAQSKNPSTEVCGEVVTLATHDGTTTASSSRRPRLRPASPGSFAAEATRHAARPLALTIGAGAD